MGRSKSIDKLIINFVPDDFAPMDICQACGKYDTIQTYIQYKGKWRHICEECFNKHFKAENGAS